MFRIPLRDLPMCLFRPPAILTALVLATLSACGGGGGGSSSPPVVKKNFVEAPDTVDRVPEVILGPLGNVRAVEDNGLVPTRSWNIDAWGDAPLASSSAGQTGQRMSYVYERSAAEVVNGSQDARKGRGVTVAIADSGIDFDHPDLAGAFKRGNTGAIVGLNLSSPNQSDFGITQNATFSISHGTHVAGIVGARDNDLGVIGIAPESTLLPIKIIPDADPEYVKFAPDLDPDDKAFDDIRSEFRKMSDFVRKQDARVINASFGYVWRPKLREIPLHHSRDGQLKYAYKNGKGYFLQPRQVSVGQRSFAEKIFDQPTIQALTDAEIGKRRVVVFSAGNDGWNGQSGKISIFGEKLPSDQFNRYANPRQGLPHGIVPVGKIYAATKEIKDTGTPPNIPSPLSSVFIGNSFGKFSDNASLKGGWLAVVAVDKYDRIVRFSNGCGIAKNYCLAAGGYNVLSTNARQSDGKDLAHYALSSGTSMAAPVVSGALAVLMSQFPNLSGKDAVKLLLCTADDLVRIYDFPEKLVDECLTNGPEATHTSGWTPSDVHGHGRVNLDKAMLPQGKVQASNRQARAVPGAFAKDSRFAFSSVFGDAASRSGLSFGAFDSFNRAYSFKAPLVSRLMPTPGLDAVMNQTVTEVTQTPGWSGPAMVMRWSNDVASPIGKGHQIRFTAGSSAARIGFTQSQMSSVVMPLGSLNGHDEHHRKAIWPKLSPLATDLVNGGVRHEAGSGVVVGVDVTSGQLGKANSRTSAYDFVDVAASASLRSNGGRGPMRLGLRAGRFREDGHFLGSLAEGGYELAKGSHSNYVNAEIEWQRGPWTARLHGTEISGKMDFKHNSFVDDTSLRANEFGLGLFRQNAGAGKGRLGISYKQPLAVSSGVLSQHSVRGYEENGEYKVVNDRLDLGVVKRHEMLQLDYEARLMSDVIWFVSASTHRNWSNFAGQDNQMLHVGVKAKF